MSGVSSQHNSFVPSPNVVTSIVLPTIFFCVGMVVAMLIGINKCKQWELDKIGEMRRTRRVIQRITARLREKNFRTIQKARNIRKRAGSVHPNAATDSATVNNFKCKPCEPKLPQQPSQLVNFASNPPPPPFYSNVPFPTGTSPPPTYEDSLLDQLYYECLPPLQSTKVLVRNRRPSSNLPSTSKTSRR